MRFATNVIRTFVGLLFIASGLIKANDPSGLGYKMEEFFEAWNSSLDSSHFILKTSLINLFSYLHEHALILSFVMIALEIMAGLALLIGWRKRLVLTVLLILIIFFTILTGYAYASGKFKNCGCFGDCLPISPLTSFLKDIVLLILIVWLVINQRWIQPLGTAFFRRGVLLLGLVFSLMAQWYVLNYLPLKDCLPFKTGNSIPEQMKIPANAIQDSFAIRFIYEKEGKRYEFSATDLPPDLNQYKFISRNDILIRKGNAEAPIKAFSLISMDNEDVTQTLLQAPDYAIWYFLNPDKNSLSQWKTDLPLIEKARQKNIPLYIITSQGEEVLKAIQGYPVIKCDVTIFRTAARTNPCIYLMRSGRVEGKWSGRNYQKAAASLDKIPMQQSKVPHLQH
jgi:uncharacterized membrane protein YphA (DoxX/SURF4 family)